jgi:hypothetical protein
MSKKIGTILVSGLCLCLLIGATNSGPTIPLIQRVEALEKEVTSLKDRIQKIEDRFAPADQNKNAPPSKISPEPQETESDPTAKIEEEMKKLISLNKSMFGISLGEKLSDVKKRFETKIDPIGGRIWIRHPSPEVGHISPPQLTQWPIGGSSSKRRADRVPAHPSLLEVEDCAFDVDANDKICDITVWLKNKTQKDFVELIRKLRKEYMEFGIQKLQTKKSEPKNPRLPTVHDLQFEVKIDNSPVQITTQFIDNLTAYKALPDDLKREFPDLAENELNVSFYLIGCVRK